MERLPTEQIREKLNGMSTPVEIGQVLKDEIDAVEALEAEWRELEGVRLKTIQRLTDISCEVFKKRKNIYQIIKEKL